MGTRQLRARANALRGGDRSPGNVVVDCTRNGYGDAAVLAWLAEGTKHQLRRILPHATGAMKEFLELFGQEVAPATPMMYPLSVTFGWDVSTCCSQSRLRIWARAMGVEPQWHRPSIRLSAAEIDHAKRRTGNAHPIVVLCPTASHVPRRWPIAYWQELYRSLRALGMAVFVAAPPGQRVLDAPTLFGTWRETAAILSQADAVVANDSGPMNLAGTLGIPTVALLGPTTDGIAAHMPSVHCLSVSKRELDCVGCWGRYGYDSSCDIGCTALSMLSVDRVASAVSRVLDHNAQRDGLVTHYCGMKIRAGVCGRRDSQVVSEQIGANVFRLAASDAAMRVLDVGAHIGAFGVHCRRLMPNVRLACVEACRDNLDCLRTNVAEFATVYHAAVAYEPGSLALFKSVNDVPSSAGGSVAAGGCASVPPGRVVDDRPIEKTTIEDLMGELGWETVDVLKLDCQGLEHGVLRKSAAVQRGQVRRIVGKYYGLEEWSATCRCLADWRINVFRGGDIGLFEASYVGHG